MLGRGDREEVSDVGDLIAVRQGRHRRGDTEFSVFDQWQVQLFALILQQARVALYSEIPPADVWRVHLEPVSDLTARVSEELEKIGRDAPWLSCPRAP